MHVQPLFSMNNDASSVNIEAWFMNKVSASGVSKIPTSILLGSKQRSMETILGLSLIHWKSQKLVRRCSTAGDIGYRSYGFGHASNARNEAGFSTKSVAQLLAADDNEEMAKMTLRDMKRMLRKAIERSPNTPGSSKPAAGNHSCSSSDSGTLPSVDIEAPSVSLELLLEDSTSNSSESMSLKRDQAGISSASGSSRGVLQGKSADSFCGHKRSSMGSESSEETEVAEDDEWTLQKWQKLYHKQCPSRKRLKKTCKVQQDISESIGEICSNSSSLTLLDVSASIAEVESSQDASFSPEKVVKGNSEIDSSACKPHETLAAVSAPSPTAGILPSFGSHFSVRLEVEDESEVGSSEASKLGRLQSTTINGWALNACNKVETTPLPKLALQQSISGGKSSSGAPFRKASELLNFNTDRAFHKVSEQRKQSEDFMSSLSPGNASGFKEQRTATPVHDTDGTCKPRAVCSKELRPSNLNQVHTSSYNKFSYSSTEQLEGTLSLEHSKGTDCLEQLDSIVCQRNSKGLPNVSASLSCMETLELEEEQEPHQKPAKIPCKRKAISPMSQEFLLKASKLGEYGVSAEKRGMKKPPLVFDEGWVDVPKWTFEANDRNGGKPEALQGAPCHVKEQRQVSKVLQSDPLSVASSEKRVVGLTSTTDLHVPAHVQKIFSLSPDPPSKPQNASEGTITISPAGSSALMPVKGILRSSCQGPCGCEECASVRSRAERASEFSQRQMQDIEGLAVKLMKDLSILRNIVEDRLIQSSVKHRSPQPVSSVDQLKKVTANALETEETAKKWLVRMARDCNRYCKIMRMQGRKLTFADESGGKLCHVKVFRSEPVSDSSTGLHGRPLEANCTTFSIPNELAVEVACPVKDTI